MSYHAVVPPPREILIIKLGALGDVVRATGLLEPLRRRHAPCRVSWLTGPGALPLLAGCRLERKAELGARPPAWLSGVRFDLVLCMDEDPAAARAASIARAARRVGTYLDGRGRVRYTTDCEPIYGMSLLAADRRLADARKRANRASYVRLWARVLGLRGAAGEFRPVPPAPPRPRGGSRVVAVHAGAGARWPSKSLPVPAAAEIVRGLSRAGYEPVLVTGPGEAPRNAAIVREAGAGRVAPPRSLHSLARWLGGCRAAVCTDSLPMHLAIAAGVPCVALFGPTSRAEIETFGGAKLSPPSPCRCYYRPSCAGASPCLGRLDPARVVDQVRRLAAP